MTYNPNAPLVIGEEWPVVIGSAFPVGSNGQVVAARFTVDTADTAADLKFYAPNVVSEGRFVVEIYELGDEVADPATFATDTYRPNEDVSNAEGTLGDKWKDEGGDSAVGTLYQSIDEITLDTADHLLANIAYAAIYEFRVASAGFGSRRPAQMRLKLNLSAFGTGYVRCGIKDSITGATWFWPGQSFAGDQQGLGFLFPALSPFTLAPWSADEIRAFDSLYSFVIEQLSTSVAASLSQAYLEVDSYAENRVAVGSGAVAATTIGSDRWHPVELSTPNGPAYWARPAADAQYTAIFRCVANPVTGAVGTFAMPYLDTGSAPATVSVPDVVDCPQADHWAATFRVDAQGFVIEGSGLNYPSRAVGVIFTNSGYPTPPFTRTAAGSQPYGALLEGLVDTTFPAHQFFSGQESGDYGRVRVLVKVAALTSEDLVLQLRRASDDVVFGSAQQLAAADFSTLDLAGAGWRWWDIPLDTLATLVTGTSYYLELTSDEAHGDDRGWFVGCLTTDLDGALGDELTFSGTDGAMVGGVTSGDYDLVFFVAELPDPVADLAVVVAAITGPSDGYYTPSIEYARLTWTTTALADLFGWYQIERSDDDGATWHKIATITTESVIEYHDIEPAVGVETLYRIAVARADRTLSLWSSSVAATVAAANMFEWFLSSNEHPSLSLGFVGERSGAFAPANPSQVEQPVFGRDRMLLFTPLEQDGDRFTVRLRVGVGTPEVVRRPAFAPLDELAQAGLSYVCVRDARGSRWLCGMIIKSYDWQESPGHVHELWATVEFVETSTTFSTPDITP